jgi:hypothetical protein
MKKKIKESDFLVKKEKREKFIDDYILNENIVEKKVIEDLVSDYAGQDLNALCVLAHAAKKGELMRYVFKLQKHYDDNLRFIDPVSRKVCFTKTSLFAESFFSDCYEELGINYDSENNYDEAWNFDILKK